MNDEELKRYEKLLLYIQNGDLQSETIHKIALEHLNTCLKQTCDTCEELEGWLY